MKRLQPKSRCLAGAAGAVAVGLGGAQSLDAAVVAQNVTVAIPPNYDVDLNGDMVITPGDPDPIITGREFRIADFDDAPQPEFTTKIDSFGEGVGVAVDSENYTANLAMGTLIDASLTYLAPPGGTDDLSGEKAGVAVGNFQVGDGPGYIGVQFPIGGATHYGYVGFEGVENDENEPGPEGRVLGFGYESTPDTPIAAGAGLVPSLTADVDGDLDVDGNDLLVIQRGLGGAYDAGDIAAFKAQFGQGGAEVAAIGAVPEPMSLSLLAAGAVGVALYRRRSK
ncbi:MAG: PEP-CTERM sorting domain-containing protein [Pirellulales bacterium]|nr:PEP-CTERM sorting domain-containing protein [Pirellulales bacterium]